LESAVIVGGLSALVAGLVSLGIPKDSALKYAAYMKADKYLAACEWHTRGSRKSTKILAETSPVTLDTHAKAA
jgi:hypothetical protein